MEDLNEFSLTGVWSRVESGTRRLVLAFALLALALLVLGITFDALNIWHDWAFLLLVNGSLLAILGRFSDGSYVRPVSEYTIKRVTAAQELAERLHRESREVDEMSNCTDEVSSAVFGT